MNYLWAISDFLPIFPASAAACKPGWYLKIKENMCQICALGYFQSDDYQTSCDPCPPGKTTANLGATSFSECKCKYNLHDNIIYN